MMHSTKPHTLKVPGASIYYEVQGAGPLLLMIPGGPTDAGVFAGLAASLAGRYTVVAYDPRGNSRSVFDAEPKEQDLDIHGDDAALLIKAIGDKPAYVFGGSGGAQIGLNLAARHPGQVRALVAHEPPCLRLLPEPSEAIAMLDELYGIYRREGAGAAIQAFMERTGMDDEHLQDGSPRTDQPPEVEQMFARINGNLDYFFAHGLKPISFYVPDVEALRAGPARIVIGVGERSAGQLAGRTALALAERLGAKPVVFPGDHNGYGIDPIAFAEILHATLRSQ